MSPKQLCGLKIHINVRVNDNACRDVSKFWGLLPSPRHMAFYPARDIWRFTQPETYGVLPSPSHMAFYPVRDIWRFTQSETYGVLPSPRHMAFYPARDIWRFTQPETYGVLPSPRYMAFYPVRDIWRFTQSETYGVLPSPRHMAFYPVRDIWRFTQPETYGVLPSPRHMAFYPVRDIWRFTQSETYGVLPSPRHMAFYPVRDIWRFRILPKVVGLPQKHQVAHLFCGPRLAWTVNSEVRVRLFLDSPEPAEWGEWGDCSITCGAGWRSRYRQCEDCDRNHYRNVQSQPCVINYYCPRECHSSGSTLLKRLNLLPRTHNSMIIAYFIELMSFCTTCILGGDRSLVILYYSSFSVYIFLSIYLIKHCIH